jgi:hypothetical protein
LVPDSALGWHISDYDLLAHIVSMHLWGPNWASLRIWGLTDSEPCKMLLVMVALTWTIVSRWHAPSHPSNTARGSNGLAAPSTAATPSWPTAPAGGATWRDALPSGRHAASCHITPQNAVSPLTCFFSKSDLTLVYLWQCTQQYQSSCWVKATKSSLNSEQ